MNLTKYDFNSSIVAREDLAGELNETASLVTARSYTPKGELLLLLFPITSACCCNIRARDPRIVVTSTISNSILRKLIDYVSSIDGSNQSSVDKYIFFFSCHIGKLWGNNERLMYNMWLRSSMPFNPVFPFVVFRPQDMVGIDRRGIIVFVIIIEWGEMTWIIKSVTGQTQIEREKERDGAPSTSHPPLFRIRLSFQRELTEWFMFELMLIL